MNVSTLLSSQLLWVIVAVLGATIFLAIYAMSQRKDSNCGGSCSCSQRHNDHRESATHDPESANRRPQA